MSAHLLDHRLNENPLRHRLINHEFFRRVKVSPVTKEQVAIFIGQWWHPLHYFPTFLARCVAVLPGIESKCAISKILNQEAGEGRPNRAHEVIYIDSMARAGFTRAQTAEAAPYPETKTLVDGYRRASETPLSALGFIFATEVADLAMVSGIGVSVERTTGITDLEWVKIHVQQEPEHIEEANHATLYRFSEAEESQIMHSAEEMWRLWIAFFDRLEHEFMQSSLSLGSREKVTTLGTMTA